MNLQDSVVLVTGAGRRLGREIALGLAQRGASIVVHHGASAEGAEQTAEMARVIGVEAWTVQADLSQPDAGEVVAAGVQAGPGRLDALVNSAASFTDGTIDDIDASAWDAIQQVNLRAPYLLTRALAPYLHRRESEHRAAGAVVNLVDLSALHALSGYVAHGVSKAGLLHLTRALARELAPDIRVNAVMPGAILPAPDLEPDSPEWRNWGRRLPLQRTGAPEDVVVAVAFLLENDFITGESIRVDGGEDLLGVAARVEPEAVGGES